MLTTHMQCFSVNKIFWLSRFPQITSAADSEAVTRQKLVKGHAYSLTGAVEVMPLPADIYRLDPGVMIYEMSVS